MIPKVGEVYMLDLDFHGKVRPVVIVSREDADAPRALSIFVPLTKESRGSRYEVTMPRVPWLKLQSYANIQGMGVAGHHELTPPLSRRSRMQSAGLWICKASCRYAVLCFLRYLLWKEN